MNDLELGAYTWSEEARQDSCIKMLIRKYGENINVNAICDFVTGKLVQTDIPEHKNGPGKWLSIRWVQKKE